jgi:RsiW-degrading membrane proteinase PrsW (M82 family)
MSVTVIIGLLIATGVPLVVLYVIRALDLYGMGAFRTVLLCFAWGGVAFALAYYVNTATMTYNLVSFDTFRRFSAPVIEEILKSLILIYLVRRPNFTYFVDGAIYGFAAGVGFAIFENYFYIFGHTSAALGLAVGRVISTNLVHATGSALIGIAIGLARFEKSWPRLGYALAGYALAMSLHVGFNNLVTRDVGSLLLVYAAAVGFAGTGLIVMTIRRGLEEEKGWIEEKLGAADRVTTSEAAVVNQLQKVDDLLAPIKQKFGAAKAAEIEKFLTLQARLGILRKTLDKLANDPKMAQAVSTQMDDLRKQMDDTRRAVGAYCMLYVRNIFPADSSPLWGRLESVIQERAAARPAAGGPNLWASLKDRAAQATAGAGGAEPPAASGSGAPSQG